MEDRLGQGKGKTTGGRHGPIGVYEEELWGRILTFHPFKSCLIRGVQDSKEIRGMGHTAFSFDVVEQGSGQSGSGLAFEVR